MTIEPLETAVDFPYLGLTDAYNNSNWEALCHNLRKSRRWEGRVREVVTKTGTISQARGCFRGIPSSSSQKYCGDDGVAYDDWRVGGEPSVYRTR